MQTTINNEYNIKELTYVPSSFFSFSISILCGPNKANFRDSVEALSIFNVGSALSASGGGYGGDPGSWGVPLDDVIVTDVVDDVEFAEKEFCRNANGFMILRRLD